MKKFTFLFFGFVLCNFSPIFAMEQNQGNNAQPATGSGSGFHPFGQRAVGVNYHGNGRATGMFPFGGVRDFRPAPAQAFFRLLNDLRVTLLPNPQF